MKTSGAALPACMPPNAMVMIRASSGRPPMQGLLRVLRNKRNCTLAALALLLATGVCIGPVLAAGDAMVTSQSGIAVGRDVRDSTLNVYNRDPEDIRTTARLLDD